MDWLAHPFMQRAALAALVLAPLLGMMSPLVLSRRLAFYSTALGHAALTGVALGVMLGQAPHETHVTVFAFCLAAALGVTYLRRHSALEADSLVGVLLAFTLGLGVCLLTVVTRRFDIHLIEGAMFGNVLALTDGDLRRLVVVCLLVGAAMLLLHNRLWASALDPSGARAAGQPVALLDYAFMVLLTLTLCSGIELLGALLVEGLVLVPAAAARCLTRSLRGWVLASMVIALLGAEGGLYLSYRLPVPSGAAIVLVLAGLFGVCWVLGRLRPSRVGATLFLGVAVGGSLLAVPGDPGALTGAGPLQPAVHAGDWYPAEPEDLRAALDHHLAADGGHRPLALVVPHAGLENGGPVAGPAYARLRGANVGRVWLLGPAHRVPFEGVALPPPGLAGLATPLGPVPVDRAALAPLRGRIGFRGPPMAHLGEHSLEMQAIFLARVLPGVPVVPLLVGRLGGVVGPHELAAALGPLVGGRDLVVATSDFTHHGPHFGFVRFRRRVREGIRELLVGATRPLLARDEAGFLRHLVETGDTICGRDALRLLMALLGPGTPGEELAATSSGEQLGRWQNSVSYWSAAFRGRGSREAIEFEPAQGVLGEDEAEVALGVARTALVGSVRDGRTPSESALRLTRRVRLRARAFVSLKVAGVSRGCLGSIDALLPLWQEIRDSTIQAATRDPRHPPIRPDELPGVEITVHLPTTPRPVADLSEIRPGRHGLLLTAGERRSLLLPHVLPEQGWGREAALEVLCRKAGLPTDAWRGRGLRLEVFEVQRISGPL